MPIIRSFLTFLSLLRKVKLKTYKSFFCYDSFDGSVFVSAPLIDKKEWRSKEPEWACWTTFLDRLARWMTLPRSDYPADAASRRSQEPGWIRTPPTIALFECNHLFDVLLLDWSKASPKWRVLSYCSLRLLKSYALLLRQRVIINWNVR